MKHAGLVARMSLEEKAAFVAGDGFWHTRTLPALGIPSAYMTDGPHGVRSPAEPGKSSDFGALLESTAFPTASLLACSFDISLLEEEGRALAEESRERGVALLLGPGANIKRSPLCGRNFEYFSEDPHLSGALAAAWIRGLQSGGVGASLKHFAANNQEKGRMIVDALVEPRALREIYLASFEEAVEGGRPASVMCAYNKLNGSYCSENGFLTREVLRKDWGYEGFVVTDWGASADRIKGLEAGIDLEMPESLPPKAIAVAAAVRAGTLDHRLLDESVDRLLDFVLSSPVVREGPGPSFDRRAHHELARRLARESIVLLKNEGGLLPLAKDRKIGLVGELARTPRYQGAGSSFLKPTRLESLVGALEEGGHPFDFAPGYRIDRELPEPSLVSEALALARRVHAEGGTLVVAVGLTELLEGEGFDRSHLRLPDNQADLLPQLAAACPSLVALYVGGSPVETTWLAEVPAFLVSYLGGQASGAAQVDLLYGDHNPSGKLAETWPLRLEDTPSHGNFPGRDRRVLYKEGLFVGYRWYSSARRAVAFPFGAGLGYAPFAYSEPALSATLLAPGRELRVSFTLENRGARRGKEVAQAYLSFPDSALERPGLALAAFSKFELAAGERRRVELVIDTRALRHWDEKEGRFAFEGGRVLVHVGGSSADLPLKLALTLEGEPLPPSDLPRLDLGKHPSELSDADFAARLGLPLPPPRTLEPFGSDSLLVDLGRASRLVSLFTKVMVAVSARSSGARRGSPNYRMVEEMIAETPLSRLVGLSEGRLSPGLAAALVELAKGRPLAALGRLFGGGDSS